MTCFTCHRCLLLEISCFLYLFDILWNCVEFQRLSRWGDSRHGYATELT